MYIGCEFGEKFNRVVAKPFTLTFLTHMLSSFIIPRVVWVRRVRQRIILHTWVWIRFNCYVWYRFGWVVVCRRISYSCESWWQWLAIWWWWRATCYVSEFTCHRYRIVECMYQWHIIMCQRCSCRRVLLHVTPDRKSVVLHVRCPSYM